jgi:N-acetylneuraminic acid mutarotase
MRHCTVAAAALALGMLGLLSCDQSATAPRLDQLTLDVVSGNGQTGVVGTELAPLIVKVTSGGNPLVGQILNFRVVSGGGSVYGGTELTDNDGIAQELWTLGTSTAVQQSVEVRAVESSTGAKKVFAAFTATALPGPGAEIAIRAGNQQTAHPLSSVPIAPAVQVTDQYGNPVSLPNVNVTFVPDDGSGRVTNARATTDANGIATVGSWIIGSACGSENTLTATATANGIAGNAATFTARAGDCWTTKASMPTARQLLGTGTVGGTLYAVGGFNGTVLETVEAYDPNTTAWITEAPLPTARVCPGVAAINGVLYAVGGDPTGSGNVVATVEAYDPATNTWTTKASMPTARNCPGVAVVNGILYAVGGATENGTMLATLEAYDPTTNTWTTKASMPTARVDLGAAVINGILYAVGGFGVINNVGTNLGTVEAYDPAANAWSTKASMPTGRHRFGVGVINGILYAVGGQTSQSSPPTFASMPEAYDPSTDSWSTKAPMPTVRSSLGATAINGVLYAVGGVTVSGALQATVEAYQP